MPTRSGSERATVTADPTLALAVLKNGGAAQILQNAQRCFDPLLSRFARDLGKVIVSHLLSDFAHRGAKRSRVQLLRNGGQDEIEQRPVRFRENLLCLRSQAIAGVRFAKPLHGPRLANKSIPLQGGEMGADCVVSELESRGQIIDCSFFPAE